MGSAFVSLRCILVEQVAVRCVRAEYSIAQLLAASQPLGHVAHHFPVFIHLAFILIDNKQLLSVIHNVTCIVYVFAISV